MNKNKIFNNIMDFLNRKKKTEEEVIDEDLPEHNKETHVNLICEYLQTTADKINEIDFSDIVMSKEGFKGLIQALHDTHEKSLDALEENEEDEFEIKTAFAKENMSTYWIEDTHDLVVCTIVNSTLGIYALEDKHWDLNLEDVRWH